MAALSLPSMPRLAVAFLVVSLLAACSKKTDLDDPNGLGPATPGSVAEFQSSAVGDKVFFDTDSSEINSASQTILDRQAQWLVKYSRYSFSLEGHADERGTREYNFALGARRAEAVKNYLAARGVNTGRVRTNSFGKERPVAVCNDISCWSQNRRVQTILSGG